MTPVPRRGRLAARGRDDEARRAAQSKRYARIADEMVEQLGRTKGAAMSSRRC
jgi:hypothetical protein